MLNKEDDKRPSLDDIIKRLQEIYPDYNRNQLINSKQRDPNNGF